MTHEEKIKYLQIALGVCQIKSDYQTIDTLISLYELILEKEGQTDVDSIVDVQQAAKQRADIKSRSELLDKVSEKVA